MVATCRLALKLAILGMKCCPDGKGNNRDWTNSRAIVNGIANGSNSLAFEIWKAGVIADGMHGKATDDMSASLIAPMKSAR